MDPRPIVPSLSLRGFTDIAQDPGTYADNHECIGYDGNALRDVVQERSPSDLQLHDVLQADFELVLGKANSHTAE